MIKLMRTVSHLLEEGEDLVLATIISHAGSTPRSVGTKMVVRRNGTIIETIGGGLVEAEILKVAPEVFKTGRAQVRIIELMGATAATADQMICGGRLMIMLEYLAADTKTITERQDLIEYLQKGRKGYLVKSLQIEPEVGRGESFLIQDGEVVFGRSFLSESWLRAFLPEADKIKTPFIMEAEEQRFFIEPTFVPGTAFIFGAGHVSQQVAEIASLVKFRTVVLDDREEFANLQRFPKADQIVVLTSFEKAFADLEIDSDSYVVIVTRGHLHDKTVLEQALRTKAGYIGMIGSRRKRDILYQTLLSEGFTQDDIDRVHCPIGLNIGGDTPEEIAVSIVAELIKVRSGIY
ncbi:MAG TPA: XdhC family protein [Desulfomonilaceae bacterium]|nr:XdhC family protein [Desulfomonilaceae bacterium]